MPVPKSGYFNFINVRAIISMQRSQIAISIINDIYHLGLASDGMADNYNISIHAFPYEHNLFNCIL